MTEAPQPAQPSGAHAVIAALRANGVKTVFGIPGTHNLELYRHLAGSGIRHVLPRHEQGGVYAADAFSRAGGGIAPVITTSGPGVLNAATGIANAHADRVPVLVIAPGIDRGRERTDIGWMHEVKDQRAALDAIAERAETATDASHAAELVHAAFRDWTSGRSSRPIVVEVPHDVLITPADPVEAGTVVAGTVGAGTSEVATVELAPTGTGPVGSVTASVAPATPIAPSEADVSAAADALDAAARPIVVVGGGAVASYRDIRPLLQTLGAPVIATARGKGVLRDDDPLALSSVLGMDSAREAIEDADVVLLIGTELSDAELLGRPLEPRGTVIRVDRDESQLHKNLLADLPVHADAGSAAAALARRLRRRDPDLERTAALRVATLAEVEPISRPFVTLHDALRASLPEDAIIAGDSSQVTYMGTSLLWPSVEPDQLMFPMGFATLGYGLPAAIGAKLARPDRAVVCVLGDGAFMFSVQELATAAELGLPLPIVVFENGGFGEIRDEMDADGIERLGVDIEPPDYSHLAAAFGVGHAAPTTAGAIADAVRAALAADRPTLIVVRAADVA